MMERLKEFQSFLSKELRPEQYNGIINLMYIIYNPKATSDQIESALVMCYSIFKMIEFEIFLFHFKISHLFIAFKLKLLT